MEYNFDERDLDGIRKILDLGILSNELESELEMFWIKYSTILQLNRHLEKNVRIVQTKEKSNITVVYILNIKYIEESEKCRVKLHSDQINILYYENNVLRNSVIYTKDPEVCDDELSITIDSEHFDYKIKELTDGEYEEEIIKSIYLHYGKGKETKINEKLENDT